LFYAIICCTASFQSFANHNLVYMHDLHYPNQTQGFKRIFEIKY
jgi:hypothetical protein